MGEAEVNYWGGEPNFIAWAALVLFAPFTLICFARMRPHIAAAWTLIGAVMFLPEVIRFDLPALPPMDKLTIATTWVFVGCMWKARHRISRARPFRGIDLFFVVVLVAQLGTIVTNGDALVTGPVTRQGLTLYDAFAGMVKDTLGLFLPFLIGRAMFRTRDELNEVLRILVIAGLVYTAFALFEVRMSPQSHRLLYGFHPASFEMTIRGGGYRPTIFMLTGLGVAMFFLSAVIAAIARWKVGQSKGYVPAWLTLVLVLCKSTGAIVYAVFLVPIVALVRKPRFTLSLGLALLVFTFPLLRGADLFPTRQITDVFMGVSEDRALSLWFRFENEDALLERARERPLFGWGGYSRQRIFDEATGEDLSVTDGQWIIELGQRGVIGFVGLFGLLLWPVVQTYRARKKITDESDRILIGALALIVAINAVDLLPNGTFSFLPYFYSGILAGVLPALSSERERRARGPAARAELRRRAARRELEPA